MALVLIKCAAAHFVYLTITQELLQQASERFRVLGARILRASTGGKAWNRPLPLFL